MELIKETKKHYNIPKQIEVFQSYYNLNEPIFRFINENQDDSYLSYKNIFLLNNLKGLEDPRPFILNNKRYILTQKWNGCFENIKMYIINVDTNEYKEYIVNEPNFFYGKNWVPFVYNNELYIIYGFDPFIILKDGNVIVKINTNLEKQNGVNFCQYRGGTNGIQIDDNIIIGFGHRTINTTTHIPFLWKLDIKNRRLIINNINYNNYFNIIDPTSLWIENNNYYLSICESSNRWDYNNLDIYSRIFKIDISKLNQLTIDNKEFAF